MKEPSVTLNLVRTSLVIPTRGLSQDYRVLTGVGEGGGERGGNYSAQSRNNSIHFN